MTERDPRSEKEKEPFGVEEIDPDNELDDVAGGSPCLECRQCGPPDEDTGP